MNILEDHNYTENVSVREIKENCDAENMVCHAKTFI